MENQIHPATKRSRAKKLIEILQRQSLENHQRHVGQLVQVLVEGPSEETELLIAGRMPTQAQEIDGNVMINDTQDIFPEGSEDSLRAGDLVEVEITEALPHDLLGRAVRMISRARGQSSTMSSTRANTEWRGESSYA